MIYSPEIGLYNAFTFATVTAKAQLGIDKSDDDRMKAKSCPGNSRCWFFPMFSILCHSRLLNIPLKFVECSMRVYIKFPKALLTHSAFFFNSELLALFLLENIYERGKGREPRNEAKRESFREKKKTEKICSEESVGGIVTRGGKNTCFAYAQNATHHV